MYILYSLLPNEMRNVVKLNFKMCPLLFMVVANITLIESPYVTYYYCRITNTALFERLYCLKTLNKTESKWHVSVFLTAVILKILNC